MPTRFIHSKSLVMPASVTLPLVQCHHVRGFAESGGFTKPFANASCSGGVGVLCARRRVAAARVVAAMVKAKALRFGIMNLQRMVVLRTYPSGLLLRVKLCFEKLQID